MSLRIYVAAPFISAPFVRDLHARLSSFGFQPTSTWALNANGAENLIQYPVEKLRAFAAQNDSDLKSSDVALMIAREGMGAESFAESRMALEWKIPVLWCGRRSLSTYREGVVIVDDLDDAIAKLALMAKARVVGVTGLSLAKPFDLLA